MIKQTGNQRHKASLKYPLRLIVIDTGKRLLNGKPDLLVLCTNRLDLPAEKVALAYKHRWAVELFFRWLKSILGCRHLLANSRAGVTIQVYLAIIASLLISLWVGRKPTIRTREMIQFYITGWVPGRGNDGSSQPTSNTREVILVLPESAPRSSKTATVALSPGKECQSAANRIFGSKPIIPNSMTKTPIIPLTPTCRCRLP